MSAYKFLSLFFVAVFLLYGCKEELTKPAVNDGVAPGPVSNVEVENQAGAAVLTYTLPADPDLLYVEAVYSIRPNVYRNAKSSFYNNNLRVEGFGESREYEVTLYAVDKGENRSAPVKVKINPGVSPVQKVFNSLQVTASYGGINVKYVNEDSANIVITTLIKGPEGTFIDLHKHYTKNKAGSYYIRGLPSVDTLFGVYINDRYDNITDTFEVRLTPVFEEMVPYGQITVLQGIAGDVGKARAGWNWTHVFDGNLVHTGNRFLVTETNTGIPQQFTMDFQKPYKISRFKLWQRRDTEYFTQGIREFELYGSMNPPKVNGEWDGEFIGKFDNSYRPSGLPNGTSSAGIEEDIEWVLNGSDFEFPPNTPAYRYYKFRTTKVWGFGTFIVLGELVFWGQQQ